MTVIPLLPCASIDDMEVFYEALGFTRTYRQLKPNPYLGMRRGDVEIHFFGMEGFNPADSYGSCVVLVPDTAVTHREFAEGLRAAFGRVPLSGIPRMTRPRSRRNVDRQAGFSVVDPGGNWIRVFAATPATPAAEPSGKLARAVENAVVQADGRGDPAQAAKILDGALRRADDASAVDLVEALAYRAELAITLGDAERAAAALAELDAVPLTPEDRERLADTLAHAAELR
ncbi:hypothetical protein [Saccharothrix obliqua]|uniref:hypothetical protein n=1 Tax=Saccharothrix obliqua TaxID=2861747 RepID=UPI001C5FA8DD|nr:hypothetical protein [Saccharothrix obliqua]MBW4717976.1 hypothetical protein [Saccharothrix obliqua]